ncbi:MAG: hypothetical protein JWQ30_2398 [Sediminibacterium sp.]|nr:hypothetical protein [Sediminibacterium sp.]
MNKKNKPSGPSKKDLRAKLTDQLHEALSGFKEAVHEKKLQKLVKKAAKMLADGLHHNKPASPVVNKQAAPKKAAPKKAAKKAAPKKAAPKKGSKKK